MVTNAAPDIKYFLPTKYGIASRCGVVWCGGQCGERMYVQWTLLSISPLGDEYTTSINVTRLTCIDCCTCSRFMKQIKKLTAVHNGADLITLIITWTLYKKNIYKIYLQ